MFRHLESGYDRRQGWNFHVTTKLNTTDRVTIASLANTLAHRWLVPRPIRFKIHDYVFMTGGNKWRDQTTRLIIPPFFPGGNTRLDWPDGAQSASRARSLIEDGVANRLSVTRLIFAS